MNSLLLGLALSTPQTALAHPPAPPVVVGPVVTPYRPVYVPPPPPVVPVVPVAPAPMTLAEFARCFRPTPGPHEVWLVHPITCRPVKVCFTLPPGCPRVKVHKKEIEFDYGRREVEIRFRHNGTASVRYE